MVAAPSSKGEEAEEDAGRVQWPKPSPAWQPEEGRRHQEPSAPSAKIEAPPEPAPYVPANETPADETPAGTALVVHDEAASLPAPGEPRPTELAGVWEIFPLDTSFPSPPPAEDLAPPPAEARQSADADSTLPPAEPPASPVPPDREAPIELQAVSEPTEPTLPAPGVDDLQSEPSEATEPAPLPSEPPAAEPDADAEGPPDGGVDFVSLAAEGLGAGQSGRKVRLELVRRGLHPDDAKEVVAVMGKECARQRKNGVSLLTVTVGGALAVAGLAAFVLCRFHHPPYRGPALMAAGFGVAGLALFVLGLWRLAIRPAPVNPVELITVWDEPR